MKAIQFKLITPTAIAYEGEAELVIAVGTEGEEGILASHAPFLTALRPGVLRANVLEGGEAKRLEFATSQGFMQALPDRLKSLRPQTAEYAREQAVVDFAQAKLALAG